MLSYALGVYRGDTKRWRVVVWADEDRTIPADLAGVAVAAEIRASSGSTPVTAIGCSVTAPNQIDLTLAPSASAGVPSPAIWDLQLTYPSGDVQTIVKGSVLVTGDVTQSQVVARLGRVA